MSNKSLFTPPLNQASAHGNVIAGPIIGAQTIQGAKLVGAVLTAPNPTGGPVKGATASPAAFELAVISYDPAQSLINVRATDKQAGEVKEVTAVLSDPAFTEGLIKIALGEGPLAARVEIRIVGPARPPKFATVEEADAWLEEHS